MTKSIYHSIAALLARGESLTLATIVSRSGSAPRAAGSRLAMRQDGGLVGTIGGGVLEARVRELAPAVRGPGQAVLKKYTLTAGDAARMGMVCGGVVQVLVQFLSGTRPEDRELYRDIAATLEAGEKACLITALPSAFEIPELVVQYLIKSDGAITGGLAPQIVQTLVAQAGRGRPQILSHEGKPYLVEALGRQGTVYIFGAGHISQQLAPLAGLVGFRTVVLDDRQEFANRERFPDAHEVMVLNSFQGALEGLAIDGDSYLVLLTRGHAHDQAVLRQALSTPAGYIGMIGSRGKRQAIYAALAQAGFSQADFQRVSSPIGLNIAAETPEEIAVSIVAELIQVRAGRSQ